MATLLVHIPQRGERPPYDFDATGLYRGERTVQVPSREIEEIRRKPANALGWNGEVELKDGTVHLTVDLDHVLAQMRAHTPRPKRGRR